MNLRSSKHLRIELHGGIVDSGKIAPTKQNYSIRQPYLPSAFSFFCVRRSGTCLRTKRLRIPSGGRSQRAIGGQSLRRHQPPIKMHWPIRRDVPEVWANLGLMQHQAGDFAGALAEFQNCQSTATKVIRAAFVSRHRKPSTGITERRPFAICRWRDSSAQMTQRSI